MAKDPGDKELALQAINLTGEAYQSLDKKGPAIKAYSALIGMEPVASDLRLAGLAQLAYLYEEKKDLQNAILIYEKIVVSEGKKEWVDAATGKVKALTQQLNPTP